MGGFMGVPGSNPGGPMIFQRKIEDWQDIPRGAGNEIARGQVLGGEKGLGQGWVFGGQYPARSAISSNRGAGFVIAWG